MIKKYLMLLIFAYSLCGARPVIFESNGGHIGDHLTSLYNAYVLAKKYDLELVLNPFPHCELFECYNLLRGKPNTPNGVIEVRNESNIQSNLSRNIAFNVNVLTDRPTPDTTTAQEAKKLCMINKNINFDYLPKIEKDFISIAVHIRKGNNSGIDGFVGQLASDQIFDFNHSMVNYIYNPNRDPFGDFGGMRAETREAGDRWWSLKFPPEQFYIDQVAKVINAKGIRNVIVRIFTDHKNPQELISHFKAQLNPETKIEFYNNHEKILPTRIVEDLYLMAQCDILIRAKSGFSVVAEILGDFKTVIFPIERQWDGNKLIMTKIVIRGEPV